MNFNETTHSMSGIYRILFENEKSYIGLTNDLRRRMIEHLDKDVREHPELPISKAIKKYSIKDIILLEEIDANDREKLKQQEKYWIAFYDTFNNQDKGYNITPGGDGASSGVYNVSASLNQEQLDLVIDLLLNSNLTYEEIIDKLNISITRSVIRGINAGTHYKNPNLKYPLREKRLDKTGIENKTSKFYQNEDLLKNIIEALKNPQIPFTEITQLYGISSSSLTLINTGKKYKQDNLTYPIRPKNANQKRVFSQEEMEYIKSALHRKETMQSIATYLKCDRKVISDINCGKRQKQLDWEYPLNK